MTQGVSLSQHMTLLLFLSTFFFFCVIVFKIHGGLVWEKEPPLHDGANTSQTQYASDNGAAFISAAKSLFERPDIADGRSPYFLTSFSLWYYSETSFMGLLHIPYNPTVQQKKLHENTWEPADEKNHQFKISMQSLVVDPSGSLHVSPQAEIMTNSSWVHSNPYMWSNFKTMRSDPKVTQLQSMLVDDYILKNRMQRILTRVRYNIPDSNIQNADAPILDLMKALILNRVRRDNSEWILREASFKRATLGYCTNLLKQIHLKVARKKGNFEGDLMRFALEWFLSYLVQSKQCSTRYHCLWLPMREMMQRVLESIEVDESFGLVLPIDISRLLVHYLRKRFPKKFSPRSQKHSHCDSMISFNEYGGLEIDVAMRRAIGYLKSSLIYSSFEADLLMAELSRLEVSIIQELRKAYMDELYFSTVFRYFIIDPNLCSFSDHEHYKPAIQQMKNDHAVLGRIPIGVHGTVPLILPGESVVSHQRGEHRFSVLGKYNPSLINYEFSHILENKYLEYKFWNHFVPGIMPRTELLSELVERRFGEKKDKPWTCTLDEFLKVAHESFPEGFVVKGSNDYAAEYKILSSDVDLRKQYGIYNRSRDRFDAFVERQKKIVKGCEENEDLLDTLRPRREYFGYKLDQFFKETNVALLQSKLNIQREFRVEVVAGSVLEDAILDRFYFRDIKSSGMVKFRVAEFVRDIIDQLPSALRYMPMTMDVACIQGCGTVNETHANLSYLQEKEQKKDFTFRVIEANPGAQSWFTHTVENSVHESNRFFWNYPQYVHRESYLRNPLSPEKQIETIRDLLSEWGLREEEHWPLYQFYNNHITDKNVNIHRVSVNQQDIGKAHFHE